MAQCTLCRKRAVSGNAVSHSQIHTKRKFKPNLQKVNGLVLCTSCLRTLKKYQRENSSIEELPEELVELTEAAAEQHLEDEAQSEEQSEKDKEEVEPIS